MRYILAVMALTVCAYIGHHKSARIDKRRKLLEILHADINEVNDLMEYRRDSVAKIVERMSARDKTGLWKTLSERLNENDTLANLWAEALEELSKRGSLSPLSVEELDMLREFGMFWGMSDAQTQRANILHTLKRIEACIAALNDEYARTGKMYKSLGILGGLAMAIMII